MIFKIVYTNNFLLSHDKCSFTFECGYFQNMETVRPLLVVVLWLVMLDVLGEMLVMTYKITQWHNPGDYGQHLHVHEVKSQ